MFGISGSVFAPWRLLRSSNSTPRLAPCKCNARFFSTACVVFFPDKFLYRARDLAWRQMLPPPTHAMLHTRPPVHTASTPDPQATVRSLVSIVAIVAAVILVPPSVAADTVLLRPALAGAMPKCSPPNCPLGREQTGQLSAVVSRAACLAKPGGEEMPEPPSAADAGFWLVNTRSRRGCEYVPRVEWYACTGGWQSSHLQALLATDDPRVVTVIYVHGNDTSAEQARQVGLAAYRQLGVSRNGQHVRFIAWSWPSDRVRGRIARDARIKAAYAEIEGYQLARFVADLSPGVPVSLVGFSFGARVITAAAHLLGGGSLRGRRLDDPAPPRPLRGVLLAAGLDRDWIVPGNRHGQALAVCERMLLLVNHHDRVLRYYPRISDDRRTPALGYAGAPLHRLAALRDRVVQWNVNPYVRRAHGWEAYLYNGSIMARVRREAWFQDDRRGQAL